MSDFDMVKQLHDWGIDIEEYVALGLITKAQLDEIQGGDNVVPPTTSKKRDDDNGG